ncbi:hypothetical protein ACVIKO_006403 [Rhizobium ruizarguesonis]|jgi:hypothetical protein
MSVPFEPIVPPLDNPHRIPTQFLEEPFPARNLTRAPRRACIDRKP